MKIYQKRKQKKSSGKNVQEKQLFEQDHWKGISYVFISFIQRFQINAKKNIRVQLV